MRKLTVALPLLLLLAGSIAHAQAAEDRARFAAEQWIVLVDDGQYDESWKEADKLFQNAIPAEEWQKKVAAERTQLGARQSRRLKDIKPAASVKGLPGGQYYLVRYQSVYANKKTATETITALLDSDGNWRVAQYSVN
jgi:hypothetical protein